MFRPIAVSHRRTHRRGTSFILIVVVMLSLFSAVGTAYALFAMRELRLAQARKDEQGGGGGGTSIKAPDPTETINQFFSALIYDKKDEATYDSSGKLVLTSDVLNGLRGHSIARSMYGYDRQNPYNTTPWNGVGLFHESVGGVDRPTAVNYTLMRVGGAPFLLDPEIRGVRQFDPTSKRPVALTPGDPSRPYVSKAAPYSYADLKDFFLAAYDPATGEVLVPSFHRQQAFGSLAPTNPNWTSDTGKLLTLRPRHTEHPNFPRVGPDPDGQYRGDVQNLPGGVGMQRNDSVWIDLGLPPITLPGGRKVKPLVAPLILPLNGYLNANAHGNTYNGGQHSSYHGLGSWEVNLGWLLDGAITGPNSNNVVGLNGSGGRGALQQRNGLTTQRWFDLYNPSRPLTDYSPIAWVSAGTMPPTFPYQSDSASLAGQPTLLGQTAYVSGSPAHPSLFNPSEWPEKATLTSRSYPLSDSKMFLFRYAGSPATYEQSDLAGYAGLGGPPSFSLATSKNAAYGYRTHPSHHKRGLLTTLGFDLDRPKVAPNFTAASLQLAADANAQTSPAYAKPAPTAAAAYPQPQNVGQDGDFQSATQWWNKNARLGSVDLNRPLADYRGSADINQPLTKNKLSNEAQATADRQKLAHDIFVRLAVATGASINVNNPTQTPAYQLSSGATTGTPQYNALRYLAQLAVNAVDYIDNDDISTRFAWNPGNMNDAVYGVEKTRLVINEAYSEITNDPADKVVDPDGNGVNQPLKNAKAHVRFWLELMNPTSKLTSGPLGTGSVSLAAYQIEIARVSDGSSTNPPYWHDRANTTGSFDASKTANIVYKLDKSDKVVEPNFDPNNAAAAYNPAGDYGKGIVLIGPKLDQTKVKNKPNNPAPKADEFYEFNPELAPVAAPWDKAVFVPTTADPATAKMYYTVDTMPAGSGLSAAEYKRHVVLLRRLANPYADPDPTNNPYVTVDVMDYVPAFDAVARADMDTDPRSAGSNAGGTEYDPMANRFSVGKVQPYAGHSYATVTAGPGKFNTYEFADTTTNGTKSSTVLDQKPTTPVTNHPKHTFGRHNGKGDMSPGAATVSTANPPALSNGESIMLPFDWMVHLDRPLVNQLELLHVRDTPPHLVTDYFVRHQQTTGLNYEGGTANWLGNGLSQESGLARALEYLSVRPYTAGVAHGGRVPGKVNANAISDQRVLFGVMDPQQANLFDTNFVANTAWSSWVGSRTQVGTVMAADGTTQINRTGAPKQSLYEGSTAYNPTGSGAQCQPFTSFGAPYASAGSFAYGGGASVDNTILRRDTTGTPLLFTNQSNMPGVTYPASQPNGPSYFRAEPARKMLNNLTTVNHQFIVFVTIGYFDVVGDVTIIPGNNPGDPPLATIPQLGAEAFISVPGDMRQKVVAIVDMSKMALNPQAAANTDPHATDTPFFTSVEQTVYTPNGDGSMTLTIAGYMSSSGTLCVGSDGQDVEISDGTTGKPATVLVLGYGAEEQIVQVKTGGINPATSQVTVLPLAGALRTVYGGTSVSNVRPGYPGPRTDFNYTEQKYKAVLPYVERLK